MVGLEDKPSPYKSLDLKSGFGIKEYHHQIAMSNYAIIEKNNSASEYSNLVIS